MFRIVPPLELGIRQLLLKLTVRNECIQAVWHVTGRSPPTSGAYSSRCRGRAVAELRWPGRRCL